MKKVYLLLAALMIVQALQFGALGTWTACADYTIVDTGAATPYYSLYYNQGIDWQWMAGEFTTTQAYSITDIYGYLSGTAKSSTFTIALYTNTEPFKNLDGSYIPGNLLFQQQATVNSSADGWYGLSGLNWNLAAGNYWVAFEVTSNDTYSGAIGSPAQAMENEAIEASRDYWTQLGAGNISVQVLGNPAPNPIPPTMALLGSGLVGLIGIKRKYLG